MQVFTRVRMIRHFRTAAACAIATATAGITIGAVVWPGAAPATSAAHTPRHAVALEPRVNWEMPLIGAHQTTLAGAGTAAGFAVPVPDITSPIRTGSGKEISLAVTQTWVNPAGEVALVFNGGKVTMLVGRAPYTHPGKAFRTDLAAIRVGRAEIGRVNGGPAFIAHPRTDYTKSNPALVEFYQKGLDINVLSTKLGTKALLAIADSVTAPGR